MPRNYKLTWQSGGKHQTGRWRKKYKGKPYYFPGGNGKSDRKAYDAAVAEWEALKLTIDAAAPRPHQLEYEQAIDQWEQVLQWSNQHGDAKHVEWAAEKLDALRRRLAAPRLLPLARDDWFESAFDPHPSAVEFGKKLQSIISRGELYEPSTMPAITIPVTASICSKKRLPTHGPRRRPSTT